MEEASDSAIWDYAIANGFTITTKDSDFYMRSKVDGHPPKVIWITLGNCSTSEVESLLRDNYQVIAAFLADPTKSFIVLG